MPPRGHLLNSSHLSGSRVLVQIVAPILFASILHERAGTLDLALTALDHICSALERLLNIV